MYYCVFQYFDYCFFSDAVVFLQHSVHSYPFFKLPSAVAIDSGKMAHLQGCHWVWCHSVHSAAIFSSLTDVSLLMCHFGCASCKAPHPMIYWLSSALQDVKECSMAGCPVRLWVSSDLHWIYSWCKSDESQMARQGEKWGIGSGMCNCCRSTPSSRHSPCSPKISPLLLLAHCPLLPLTCQWWLSVPVVHVHACQPFALAANLHTSVLHLQC